MELPPIFWEVHRNLPREGPGDNESTAKAFRMIKALPAEPRILDVGCGPGMQTIELAKLSQGLIEAVDFHQPYLDQLKANAEKEGFSNRIKVLKGDMFNLGYAVESFDLIWCEGAIFVIGFEKGLREWRPLLTKKGYLVVSELSWLITDLPQEILDYMNQIYPQAKSIEKNKKTAQEAGYRVINSFILPKDSWWTNYYAPIEAKLPDLRTKHEGEPEALQYLDSEKKESEMFRKYSDYYGYVFYVLEKS